jgi:2-dehydro-3-deoxyphosphogluconate aldolase/(4S)-4-hydroxy-2-oxoglutarate aldolase
MVKEDYIENEQWDKITELTKEAVKTMLGFKIAHIGINSENADEAKKVADMLSLVTGMPITKDGEKSIFTGSEFEIMKSMGRGKCGHIGIATTSVDRAVYHLSTKGVQFDEESATYNADGSRKFIYIKEDIGGFGIHLVESK